jgi:hypothetical protein
MPMAVERENAGNHRNPKVSPIIHRQRWNCSDQHITNDPTRISRDEGKYYDPEDIELVFDASHSAAQCKDECAGQIE